MLVHPAFQLFFDEAPAGRQALLYEKGSATAQQQRCLQFCREWAEGRESFVLQTSGSTGTPKPVSLSRQQMTASARLTAAALGLGEGDKALVCLNTAYIGGTMMLVRGMVCGLELTVTEPASLPQLPPGRRFDFTALAPLQLEAMLKSPAHTARLNEMKAVIIGGAAVASALEESLQALAVPVYHTYGMTETVSHIALRLMNGEGRSTEFTAFEGIKLSLDGRGCLVIEGPVTGGKPVVTNDLAELTGLQAFRFVGRADQVINSGGIKLVPELLEQKLSPFFAGKERRYFIAGQPHPSLGEQAVLVVEGTEPTDKAAWLEALRPLLSKYEMPKAMRFVARFRETASGKIDRKGSLSD